MNGLTSDTAGSAVAGASPTGSTANTASAARAVCTTARSRVRRGETRNSSSAGTLAAARAVPTRSVQRNVADHVRGRDRAGGDQQPPIAGGGREGQRPDRVPREQPGRGDDHP